MTRQGYRIINLLFGDASENDQRSLTNFKIVGYINDRDRLGHQWVAEMLLNAQSELLVIVRVTKRIFEYKDILTYGLFRYINPQLKKLQILQAKANKTKYLQNSSLLLVIFSDFKIHPGHLTYGL